MKTTTCHEREQVSIGRKHFMNHPLTNCSKINRKLRVGYWLATTLVAAAFFLFSTSPAISAPPDTETYNLLERFHGHTCAGSLMGLRLGLAAKEALSGGQKLHAKCSVLACPVDGIQVGAGTTYGNKALEVEEGQGLYLILTDTQSGRQVEARLTEKAMEMGKRYRDLSSQKNAQVSGSPEQVRLEKEVTAVLEWFRTAPDLEVVTIRTVK